MANRDIKVKIRKEGLYMWQVASMIPISDTNFSKWMRVEIGDKKKAIINNAIEKAKKVYL